LRGGHFVHPSRPAMTAPQFRLRLADFPESGYATHAM
jgi:hypothetical protein